MIQVKRKITIGSLAVILLMGVVCVGARADNTEPHDLTALTDRSKTAASYEVSVTRRMKSVIQEYIAARLMKRPIEINVTSLHPVLTEKAVSRDDQIEIKQGPEEGGGLMGRMVFLIAVKKKNGREVQHWVRAEVSVTRKVLVATDPIKRKERISSDAVAVQTFQQVYPAQEYAETIDELVGKQARRSILPGTPITFDMLEDAPVIRKGEQVTLMIETDGITISAAGRAKEDGFLGRQIAVVTLNWNKTVYGTVVGASTVKMIF